MGKTGAGGSGRVVQLVIIMAVSSIKAFDFIVFGFSPPLAPPSEGLGEVQSYNNLAFNPIYPF